MITAAAPPPPIPARTLVFPTGAVAADPEDLPAAVADQEGQDPADLEDRAVLAVLEVPAVPVDLGPAVPTGGSWAAAADPGLTNRDRARVKAP